MGLMSGAYPTRMGWECGVIGFGMKGYSGLPREAIERGNRKGGNRKGHCFTFRSITYPARKYERATTIPVL